MLVDSFSKPSQIWPMDFASLLSYVLLGLIGLKCIWNSAQPLNSIRTSIGGNIRKETLQVSMESRSTTRPFPATNLYYSKKFSINRRARAIKYSRTIIFPQGPFGCHGSCHKKILLPSPTSKFIIGKYFSLILINLFQLQEWFDCGHTVQKLFPLRRWICTQAILRDLVQLKSIQTSLAWHTKFQSISLLSPSPPSDCGVHTTSHLTLASLVWETFPFHKKALHKLSTALIIFVGSRNMLHQ